MEKRWIIQKSDQKFVQKLAKDLGVNHIVAHLLVLRGIENFDDAKLFFRPELKHLHDPFLMKNMQDAVDRIEKAIANKEKVLVYGDYDVDGTTSVAMMYSFLKRFSLKLNNIFPVDMKKGMGFHWKGLIMQKRIIFH